MTYPKMIIFDYVHTLCCEPGWDALRGERALFEYIKSNKSDATPEQVAEYSSRLFEKVSIVRRHGLEIHERQFMRFLCEYFGIELSIPFEQAEQIFWNSAAAHPDERRRNLEKWDRGHVKK